MLKSFVRKMSMRVNFVPALGDNLMYLIYDETAKEVAAVDPVEPEKLAKAIEPGYKLVSALTTHHHMDHSGGNEKLASMYPGIPLYGGDDRIPALSHKVKHDDVIKIGNLSVRCLFTPCHTTGHICYFVHSNSAGSAPLPPAVFTGDTLFIGGCGRFFEGTAEQMHHALNVVLAGLPDETLVFCGHEYSIQNLSFGHKVEPKNEHTAKKLQWAKQMREQGKYTVPSTIAEEKLTNPFMRVMQPDLRSLTKTNDDINCMQLVREMKDKFKM